MKRKKIVAPRNRVFFSSVADLGFYPGVGQLDITF
jgi:DNA uptake protein ComE-like DNA-binding protein